MGYRVAVVGATGAVGNEMVKILQERDFPVDRLVLLASARSAGKSMTFKGREVPVEVLGDRLPKDLDLALLATSAEIAESLAPKAASDGILVVDNSRAFRMHPEIPLVVPEVNPEAARAPSKIIANPNCSTIAFTVAAAPLHRRAGLERAVIATYQAVSGAGAEGLAELLEQTQAFGQDPNAEPKPRCFPHPILFNLIPRIDSLGELGYTGEEWKMVRESRKIMSHPELRVVTTCVRVPVLRSHSLAIHAEFREALSPEAAKDILRSAPGVKLIDAPADEPYPTPRQVADTDEVHVGRVRADPSHPRGLALWAVMDQIRKGAATNAVQIAELVLQGQVAQPRESKRRP